VNKIAVRFDNVSFSYSDTRVLEDASFHIHHGEFAAMIGPNGSGKTTVLKLLFGLEKPDKGKIEIFDGVTGKKPERNNISYVSQQMPADNMFPITVRDIVRMGLLHPSRRYPHASGSKENAVYSAVTEALEQAGIAGLAGKTYSSLSGGQKRRTLVARALAATPRLLVLDEPAANMDAESEDQLYKTLGDCKGKMTILIVTHDTGYVTSLTDRVLCLGENRKIVQHHTEKNVSARHGDAVHQSRVLHSENISGDDCCAQ